MRFGATFCTRMSALVHASLGVLDYAESASRRRARRSSAWAQHADPGPICVSTPGVRNAPGELASTAPPSTQPSLHPTVTPESRHPLNTHVTDAATHQNDGSSSFTAPPGSVNKTGRRRCRSDGGIKANVKRSGGVDKTDDGGSGRVVEEDQEGGAGEGWRS